MTPIASDTGQVIQLVLMDEVRPMHGSAFLPDVLAAIVQRYRFASFPTELVQITQSYSFKVGSFVGDGQQVAINSLDIYNDGVVVSARHTDDADLFLDDFIAWSKNQFHLREPITEIPRRYFSTVVADFDSSFGKIISNFDKIANVVSLALGVNVGFLRLALSDDPLQRAEHKTWQIEPRATQALVTNRYFSSAHLRTGEHFDMLARLEKLFQD